MAKINEQYISNGKFITSTSEEIFDNPYTEKTDILALFTSRCNETLIDPISVDDNAGLDDGARNTAINQKGWNHILDYTGEGSSGIIINGVAAKNSGFAYSRMYYNNREPDYQFICRRDGNDQYFISSKLRYDENNIFFYCKLRQLGNSFYYDYFWQLSRDYQTYEMLFKNNEAWSSTSILIGIKKYNRVYNAWSPSSFTNLGDTSIKYYSVGNTIEYEANIKEFDVQTIEINDRFKNFTIENYVSIINSKENNFYINTINTGVYEVFIEGVASNKEVTIKFFNTNGVYEYGVTQLNGISHVNKQSKCQEYEISEVSIPEYKRTIKPYTKMIRGYISGNINLSNCDVHYSSLYMLCLRNDGVKIGEYQVTSSYSYNIPNLDMNTKYNVILIDRNKDLEWIVSSYRSPAPYEEIELPSNIETLIYYSGLNNSRHIKINLNDYTKSDYFKIYYSNEEIDESKINTTPYFYSTELDNNIDSYYNQGYIYFAIVNIFNNLSSNIFTIANISVPYNLTAEFS